MKKLIVLLAIVGLLVVGVAPAAAQGGPNHGGPGHGGPMMGVGVMGTVKTVNVNTKTLTVTVLSAGGALRNQVGKDLIVKTTDATRFYNHMTPVQFGDLKVGDSVSVMGALATDGSFTAQRVTITAHSGPGGPMVGVGLMGTVTAVNVVNGNAGTLTVTVLSASPALRDKIGQSLIVQTTATTVFLNHMTPVGLADIQVGNNVSVQGALGADGAYTAQRVMISSQHPSG